MVVCFVLLYWSLILFDVNLAAFCQGCVPLYWIFFFFYKHTSVTLLPATAEFLSDQLTLEQTTVAPYRLSHQRGAEIIP